MGWAVGYDTTWGRDIGYGVPAMCDQPGCGKGIDRGLAYVCGGEPYGGDQGCGLYFCEAHLYWTASGSDEHAPQRCDRCCDGLDPFEATPDVREWLEWKLNDESWRQWRKENPSEVDRMLAAVTL